MIKATVYKSPHLHKNLVNSNFDIKVYFSIVSLPISILITLCSGEL